MDTNGYKSIKSGGKLGFRSNINQLSMRHSNHRQHLIFFWLKVKGVQTVLLFWSSTNFLQTIFVSWHLTCHSAQFKVVCYSSIHILLICNRISPMRVTDKVYTWFSPPCAAALATSSPSPNWVINGPSCPDCSAELKDDSAWTETQMIKEIDKNITLRLTAYKQIRFLLFILFWFQFKHLTSKVIWRLQDYVLEEHPRCCRITNLPELPHLILHFV